MSCPKKCSKCRKIKSLSEYYKRHDNFTSGYRTSCKKCMQAKENKRRNGERARKRNRQFAAYYKGLLGGQCAKCGYSKTQCSLEFHHVNPDEKEAGMASIMAQSSHQRVIKELDKCILLCAICHQELETKCWTADFIKSKIGWSIKNNSIVEDSSTYWEDTKSFYCPERIGL